MPSYCCKHPTCTTYLPDRGYCHEHQQEGKRAAAFYDQHVRNLDAKAFYNSALWLRARAEKLANNPVCERCQRVFAQHVHHKIPLAKCAQQQRTDQENLQSLCVPCHNETEAEVRRGGA